MLTLPADRALNVIQRVMLKEAVVEKDVYDATKKAKIAIDRLLDGLPPETYGTMYGSLEPPLGDDDTVETPTFRHLGELPPETVPTDNSSNPFPGLERPLG